LGRRRGRKRGKKKKRKYMEEGESTLNTTLFEKVKAMLN